MKEIGMKNKRDKQASIKIMIMDMIIINDDYD